MKALTPWAGWIGGFVGWALSHQAGSYSAQLDCSYAGPGPQLVIGFIAAILSAGGGLIALQVWRTPGDLTQPYAGARRFIAGTGILAAALFLLAILSATLSPLVIPSCYA